MELHFDKIRRSWIRRQSITITLLKKKISTIKFKTSYMHGIFTKI